MRSAVLLLVVALTGAWWASRTPAMPVRLTASVEQSGPKTLSLSEWRWVHRNFPDDEYRAARTTWCESRFQDDAVGAAGELGRLQILPVHATAEGYEPADLRDPDVTGRVARALLAEHPGWWDWSTRTGCPEWP